MSQPDSDTRKRRRDKQPAEPAVVEKAPAKPAPEAKTAEAPAASSSSSSSSSRKRKGKDAAEAAEEPVDPAPPAPVAAADPKKQSKAAALAAAAAAAAAAEPAEQEVELVEDEEPAKKKKQKKDAKAQESKAKEPAAAPEKEKERAKDKDKEKKASGKEHKEEEKPAASDASHDDAPKAKKQKKQKKDKESAAASAASSSSGPVIAALPAPANGDAKADAIDGDKKKAGKFSVKEKEVLKKALDEYIASHNLGDGGLEMLFSKRRPALIRGAWNEIAAALPNRTTQAVYHFCSHTFAAKVEGKWSEAETERLRTLVTTHGRMWSKIGAALGRLPGACRDKWRLIEKEYKTGRWTVEEDRKLTDLVSEVCPGEQPPREGVHWTVISERMGNRSHSACRNRWYNTLYLNLMRVEVWTKEDDIQLIQSVADQGAEDLSEVRWNLVSAKFPTNPARARFKNLMSRIPNYATLSLTEVTQRLLEQLKAQKAPNEDE